MDIRPRHIIFALAVFLGLAVIIKPELISMLFVLVFLGVVPGTDITIPAWVPMLGFTVALIFSIRWLLDQPVYHPVATAKDRSLRASARRRVLKQTSPRIVTRRHLKKLPVKV